MVNFRIPPGLPLLALGMVLIFPACTVSDQTTETAAPTAVPTEVRTDADRRAIYNSSGPTGTNSAVPDATPNRVRLGEQASDINREKRIETINTNDPNNAPPETRARRLNNNSSGEPQP